VAGFTGTPASGTAPLTVQFTDQSTGSPTSWNWSFGDGSYSTARNPPHTYSVNGTYTVSLNVTNAAGSNSATRVNYITVSRAPPVTPTSPTTDSDTPRFVPTTGAATETGAKAGERITLPFAGNLEADDSVPVVVVAISLVPSIDIQGVMVSAITAPVGEAMKIPGNPPAYYLYITINWVREEVVREADIRFSVDDGWLKDQGIAPTDLVMTRYHDTTWSELPTRMEQYSNGRYYYSATTSGFPYFAVTRKGTGVRTTTPTLISLVTITQQIKTESTTITTTRPVTPIPVRTKPLTTTTTVPPASNAESPEFPTLWIVFGVAGFTGVIISILVIRRWWIHRQNPALFRKYD
jgi:PGF-pre-PGF domain-containing protein